MSEFEIVTRPTRRGPTSRANRVTEALVDTVASGQAVCVSMNGTATGVLRSRYWMAMRKRGLRLRSICDGDTLVMWAEQT